MGKAAFGQLATLEFEGVDIRIVDRGGRPWITQTDLTRALYGIKGGDTSIGPLEPKKGKGGWQDDTPLKRAINSLRRLYDRNADEFTDDMTALLTMETAGGPQQVRIYSARGAYLMGMLAKTETAKRFGQWVLDVLEGRSGNDSNILSGLPKEDLPALRARTAAMNAVSRSLEVIVRSAGRRPAALAAPDLYRTIGVHIDLTGSETLAQGELTVPSEPEPDPEPD